MNAERIRLRWRGGFRPFVMGVFDSRSFKIAHPEFILVGKGIVATLREDDLVEALDPLHIE